MKKMFQEVRQNKITQIIISQIRGAVMQGKLAPGDKLPSEKELVDQFQVSKQTLREAMRALEQIGMIDVRKGIGGGAFIVEVDIEVTKESLANYLYFKNLTIENLSELRKLIEPHAARKAAETISIRELQKLKALNDSARENLAGNQLAEASRDESNFHRFIAEQTRNPLLILILDFVESMIEDFERLFGPDKDFFSTILDYHERIYQAIADRNATKAAAEMLDHVAQVEQHLLQCKQHLDFNKLYSMTA
jgi:GntR family transcriptional repressor for pyruvate dehydrogenase complex